MIKIASKYTPARAPAMGARRTLTKAGSEGVGEWGCGKRTASLPHSLTPSLPQDLDLDRIADLACRDAQRASPLILIPRFRTTFNRPDWVWNELREGGRLKRYLDVEKSTANQRWRGVGKARAGFQQNNKSELKLKASIPAIDYFRFRRMDKHFFDDDANLRSLRRDNPSVDTIYV